MSLKDFLTSLIILVILLIGIAALNMYIIKPALSPKFEAVSAPAPLAQVPNQRRSRVFKQAGAGQNIVATTLEKIKSMFPEKESSGVFEPRQVTRNPFFWPNEVIGDENGRSAGVTETGIAAVEQGTHLKMVILGENRKIALINNQLLFEGSTYGTDTVKNIYEKEVVLSGPSGETRIMMARASQYMPTADSTFDKKDQKNKSAHNESVESLFIKLKPFLEKGQQKDLNKVINSQK